MLRLYSSPSGTGGGNRTRDWSLEGSRVTTTPLPHTRVILTAKRRFVKSGRLTTYDLRFTITYEIAHCIVFIIRPQDTGSWVLQFSFFQFSILN